jgi:hypothetical protein
LTRADPAGTLATVMAAAAQEVLATVGGVRVRRFEGERAFFFKSGMTIDADGAPRAYHPALPNRPSGSPPGLDDLRNAGKSGHWFGVVTDTGKPDGKPVKQGANDPAPGFYVSATALVHGERPVRDPRRYVDASTIPYVVLSPGVRRRGGARLGDLATVWNRRNGKLAHAIFADVGPDDHLGEGSIALAQALGIPGGPKAGGQDGGIVYLVFAGSGNGKPRSRSEIDDVAGGLFRAWGGLPRLKKVFPPGS